MRAEDEATRGDNSKTELAKRSAEDEARKLAEVFNGEVTVLWGPIPPDVAEAIYVPVKAMTLPRNFTVHPPSEEAFPRPHGVTFGFARGKGGKASGGIGVFWTMLPAQQQQRFPSWEDASAVKPKDVYWALAQSFRDMRKAAR